MGYSVRSSVDSSLTVKKEEAGPCPLNLPGKPRKKGRCWERKAC